MLEQLREFWPQLLALADIPISIVASSHAILHKRDVRAAIGWVGVIWLSPFVGTLVYVLFGVNRISRRAHLRRGRTPAADYARAIARSRSELPEDFQPKARHLQSLVRVIDTIAEEPLVPGNRVTPLHCGDEAYPALIGVINAAKRSVTLSTYIFDNDRAGHMFVVALKAAIARGVRVRVLIDAVGARYSWPSITGVLEKEGIPVATFMPTMLPWRLLYANLRNHRKLMVVDGKIGFTGGINIREGNLLEQQCTHPIQDMHFRLDGPVVEHLQDTFAEDWKFATGEVLEGAPWYTDIAPAGDVLARGIADGPDEDFDKLRVTVLGAISSARTSILIVTPYFVPDFTITTALGIAARRGVDVRIILPRENNLWLVHWASMAEIRQVIEGGCSVWHSPPPFDHTKLFIVDGTWTLIGSSNWDARSLRLNFEFNVEIYSREFAAAMTKLVLEKIEETPETTLEDLVNRPLWQRLRDGIARLASPYL